MRALVLTVLLLVATVVSAETVEDAAMSRASPVGLRAVAAGGVATSTTGKAMKRVVLQVSKARSTTGFVDLAVEALTRFSFDVWSERSPHVGQAVAFTGLVVQAEPGTVGGTNELALVVPMSEEGFDYTVLALTLEPKRGQAGRLIDVLGRVFGKAEYVDTEGIKRKAVLVVVPTVLKEGELRRAMGGAAGQR